MHGQDTCQFHGAGSPAALGAAKDQLLARVEPSLGRLSAALVWLTIDELAKLHIIIQNATRRMAAGEVPKLRCGRMTSVPIPDGTASNHLDDLTLGRSPTGKSPIEGNDISINSLQEPIESTLNPEPAPAPKRRGSREAIWG
jgi:hypothetical protein